MPTKLESILEMFKALPDNEKAALIEKLSAATPRSFASFFEKEHCAETVKSCPHCSSTKRIYRYGRNRNGEQRYICKECGKTFVPRINSVFYKSHKDMSVWEKFFDCMINKYSVKKTAEICKISTRTAFVWRHKILDALIAYSQDPKLKGVVEADETFFRVSFKGTRHLPSGLIARHRGGDNKDKSRKQVCVECAVDRRGNFLSKIAGFGPIHTRTLHDILDNYLIRGSVLCTDGGLAYSAYADDCYGCISHVVIDSKIKKAGKLHINTVNAYHSHLKAFSKLFRGISTKYLDNYIAWFNLLYGAKTEKKKSEKLVESVVRSSFMEPWNMVNVRNDIALAA